MSRVKAIVEIGPHQGSPYANWGVYEVGPDAFEDQAAWELDLQPVKDVLEDVDTGESPMGSFIDQLEDALTSAFEHLDSLDIPPGETREVRKDFVLPYDQAHRELRDQELEVPKDSIDPQDFCMSIKVTTIEEDA